MERLHPGELPEDDDPPEEILRRFLLHVLPVGFVRTCLRATHGQIRHFGFLANRGRTAKPARCRALLAAEPPPAPAGLELVATLMFRLTGVDIGRCPVCHAGACASSASSGRATSRPPPWAAYEAPFCGPPVHRAHAPLRAEGQRCLFPRASAGPPEARGALTFAQSTPSPGTSPCDSPLQSPSLGPRVRIQSP